MKLYYDCPIETGYMFKNHDVRFLYFVAERMYPLLAWEDLFPHGALKYYVHPSNMHIFEPKMGDILQTIDGIYREMTIRVNPSLVTTIFARNNKPFITPKQED